MPRLIHSLPVNLSLERGLNREALELAGMNVTSIAAIGYAQAVRRFDASATRVAGAGAASNVDLAAEAVEQAGAAQAVNANLAVIQTTQETFKRLLDIKV